MFAYFLKFMRFYVYECSSHTYSSMIEEGIRSHYRQMVVSHFWVLGIELTTFEEKGPLPLNHSSHYICLFYIRNNKIIFLV